MLSIQDEIRALLTIFDECMLIYIYILILIDVMSDDSCVKFNKMINSHRCMKIAYRAQCSNLYVAGVSLKRTIKLYTTDYFYVLKGRGSQQQLRNN